MFRNTQSEDLVVWRRTKSHVHLAARCGECGGLGRFYHNSIDSDECVHCVGRGWFGIDPELPVYAQPGSVAKVAMLTVRYASGIALFNHLDRPDSGRVAPDDEEVVGFVPSALAQTARLAKKVRKSHENDPVSTSLVP